VQTAHRPLVVWRLTDGKPGHERQTQGLAQALQQRLPVQVFSLPVTRRWAALGDWLRGRFPAGLGLPDPALILAAGHATHVAALAARRARGGRTVVLMEPSLPRFCFDLCLVPEHDRPTTGPRVLVTRGVLNSLRPASARPGNVGLVLVGGPSKHFEWDQDGLLRQVEAIVRAAPMQSWTLTTSRRTPPGFVAAVRGLGLGQLTVEPWEETGPDWMAQALARSAEVWVSQDSVSMVYEALTSGAAVGLLAVPARGESRVSRGVERLLADGLVTSFAQWRAGRKLQPPPAVFDEAARCARWIHEQWFRDR
jgi:mitochondrial fission protein ELM1